MIKKEKYIVLVKNLILKASVGIYPKEKKIKIYKNILNLLKKVIIIFNIKLT